jgi:hypothetical protein
MEKKDKARLEKECEKAEKTTENSEDENTQITEKVDNVSEIMQQNTGENE